MYDEAPENAMVLEVQPDDVSVELEWVKYYQSEVNTRDNWYMQVKLPSTGTVERITMDIPKPIRL